MYSVNQVNQLYVVKSKIASDAHIASNSSAGAIEGPIVSADGEFVYFKYMGAGGLLATDRIKKCKIKWISYTAAAEMQKPLRTWTIAMNSNVNSGAPVAGKDYIVNFNFRNYFGMSDEDAYSKHAAARAASTTASDLYRDLAISLAKNMSREIDQPFSIQLTTASDPVAVDKFTSKSSLAGSYTGIKLTEVVQPYQRGRYKNLRPEFQIFFTPVTISGVDYYDWAAVSEGTSGSVIKNGMETADLEWFCMGERGDQYRGKDWPLSISTPDNLMVDISKEYNYLIIHFWDDIDNEGPQKSERDLTLVTASDSGVDLFALGSALADDLEVDTIKTNGAAISSTKVATPVINYNSSTHKATVTCATPGVTLKYTTNNTAPSTSSDGTAVTGEITLTSGQTLKVVGFKDGMTKSEVASKAY